MATSPPILRRRIARRCGLAASGLCLLACAAPAPTGRLDLAAAVAAAERACEVAEIDLGTPAARSALLAGWSTDERSRTGDTFVWATGEAAAFRVFVAEPRDLQMHVRCRPFDVVGLGNQRIEIRVGGSPAAELELLTGWREYGVVLPGRLLAAGWNRVELVAAYARSPEETTGRPDSRPLSAAWDRIAFPTVRPAGEPGVRDGRLRLPAGSETAWYLPAVGRRARLVSQAVAGDPADAVLEVWWRADGDPASRVLRRASARAALELRLPETPGPVRIALRAVGGDVGLGSPAVTWQRRHPVPGGVRARASAAEGIRTVVLYSVDTLRTDRLGCYGGPPGRSPHLDAFAARAAVFERVWAPSSWTKPSMATVVTGRGVFEHGVNRREDRLPQAADTLAERFAAAGWATAAFVTNAYLTAEQGFAQGFERYRYDPVGAAEVTAEALGWLDGREDRRPLFLWLHTIDPHAPYRPGEGYRRRFAPGVADEVGTVAHIRSLGRLDGDEAERVRAAYLALYDAEIAQNDDAFGDLLDGLRELGLATSAVVVFTADHGEAFFERGVVGHGWDLHAETVRVPLVVGRASGGEGRRVSAPVELADLAPTLLGAAGIGSAGDLPGRDLWRGGAPARTGGEPVRVLYMQEQGQRWIGAGHGRWKAVARVSSGGGHDDPTLFDVVADPGETRDVAPSYPVTAGWLLFEARMARAGGPLWSPAADYQADERIRRDLEALGYLGANPR